MTRLQKKCFVFSIGLHGLLAVIVILSAAFRTKPENEELQVISVIPANILDHTGAGGGAPAIRPPAPPDPAPPSEVVGRAEIPKPKEEAREPRPLPKPPRLETPVVPRELPLVSRESEVPQRPAKQPHEIHLSYVPASSVSNHKKPAEKPDTAQSSTAAELKKLRQAEESLSQLASSVQSSAAEKTIVDIAGIGGGGEVFAGYKVAVYNAYYHAWITQDSVAERVSGPVASIKVARDGTIIKAELITPSGDSSLDKSVDRALRKVTKLPAFPAGAPDEERVFQIRFNLDAKETTG